MPNRKFPTYLLTYDHGGFILWGVEKFRKSLHSAISMLSKYHSFKIGLDNECYTYDVLERENPEVLDELREYLEHYKGRFGIGSCTYGQPLSTFINEESNVRQLVYAIRTNIKHFGYTPRIYTMSEHANHAQIPQMLKQTGYEGAIMRTHFMMYGFNPEFDAPSGLWTGVDGSSIFCIPTYEGQKADELAIPYSEGQDERFERTTMDNWILTRWPKATKITLEEFSQKFSHIQPLLASRYDDAGLRCEELVAYCEGKTEYRWILLDEILSNFPKGSAEFFTRPNDFTVRMPWGYCGNEIWNMCRQGETSVLTAEKLAAMEFLLGGKDYENSLKKCWENLLVAQHHDVQICGLLQNSREFLSICIKESEDIIRKSMNYIASKMNAGGLWQITVFNPLSWQRSQLIRAEISFAQEDSVRWLNVLKSGKNVHSTLISPEFYQDGSIRKATVEFLADVFGLGFEVYAIEAVEIEQESRIDSTFSKSYIDIHDLTIKTDKLAVELNPDGGLTSIVDRAGGESIVGRGARNGFFTALIDGVKYESGGSWKIENLGNKAIAVEIGHIGPIPYEYSLTFYKDTPRIDCHVRFTISGQKIGKENGGFSYEEKLNFKLLPSAADHVYGVRDLPFVIEETQSRYVEGNYWTAITDNHTGVAFFNRGNMGAVRGNDNSFCLSLAYANDYIWGTRMLVGDFDYDFAIYPFVGDWRKEDLHRKALEYNFPAVTFSGPIGRGCLDDNINLFDFESDNVVISAVYSEADIVYVRMYEYKGVPGKAKLNFHSKQLELTEVDLLSKKITSLDNILNFKPWQIKTLMLTLK